MLDQLFSFHRSKLFTKSKYTGKDGIANTRLGMDGSGCHAASFAKDFTMMQIQGQRDPKSDGTGVPTSFQSVGPILVMSVWDAAENCKIWVEVEGCEGAMPGEDSAILDKVIDANPWMPLFLQPMSSRDQEEVNRYSRISFYLPDPKLEFLSKLDDAAPGSGDAMSEDWGSLWRPGASIITINDAGYVRAREIVYCYGIGGERVWEKTTPIAHELKISQILYSDKTNTFYVVS